MILPLIIAHAEGEEYLADSLAVPLREAGYTVVHQGSVLVGESVVASTSKTLALGGPVVLCGTVKALGTGWAHRVINAASRNNEIRVSAVQMEKDAYLDPLISDKIIVRYWEDPVAAMRNLIDAIGKYFPVPMLPGGSISEITSRKCYDDAIAEFLEQKKRIESSLKGVEIE